MAIFALFFYLCEEMAAACVKCGVEQSGYSCLLCERYLQTPIGQLVVT